MNPRLYIEHPDPNTRCLIRSLMPGDRFYFANDKKKMVWQVQESEDRKQWSYGGRTFSAGIKVKNDLGQEKYCLGKTEVVYLRHVK